MHERQLGVGGTPRLVPEELVNEVKMGLTATESAEADSEEASLTPTHAHARNTSVQGFRLQC